MNKKYIYKFIYLRHEPFFLVLKDLTKAMKSICKTHINLCVMIIYKYNEHFDVLQFQLLTDEQNNISR